MRYAYIVITERCREQGKIFWIHCSERVARFNG